MGVWVNHNPSGTQIDLAYAPWLPYRVLLILAECIFLLGKAGYFAEGRMMDSDRA